MNEFSEKITAARKAKGLSQEAAAELLSVSRQAVAKWENGKSRPSTENLLALSKLYGIPPEELSPVLPSAGSRKTASFAGIFCGASAVFAALAAAASIFGKAGIGTALCCFIIALPVQLFVHLYFRSSISGGDFSGIDGARRAVRLQMHRKISGFIRQLRRELFAVLFRLLSHQIGEISVIFL